MIVRRPAGCCAPSRSGRADSSDPGSIRTSAGETVGIGDIAAAQKIGLTAFVARPTEYGPLKKVDFEATGNWDIVAKDFGGIADKLGC
ncbi:hypothetical protein ABIB68_000143 [Bradyrhizobium sp. F1.2.2]